VAQLTFQPEETGVDLRLGVAGDAFLWRAPEDLPGMAVLAIDLGVPAVQREDRGVVEVTQPVDASWQSIQACLNFDVL
jgi:hypothetical protein